MATEEEKEIEGYCTYWESHLQVYRQPIVWLSRVLTTKQHEFVYLLAIIAFTNCLIMFFNTFTLPLLLFVGVICLIVSFALAFCLLTNVSQNFKLYPNWSEKEEGDYKEVCCYVGLVHYKIKNIFNYIIRLRKEEPKKFYGFGILLSILLSNFGCFFSTSLLLYVTVNGILLLPLAFHHQLHSHLLNQNWKELNEEVWRILQSAFEAVQKMVQKFRGGVARRPHDSHVTSSNESNVNNH